MIPFSSRQSQTHSSLQASRPLHRLGSQYHVLVFKFPFNWRQRARPEEQHVRPRTATCRRNLWHL
eukprot:2802267-Pleurochrysis_carterae.AAC.1